MRACLWEAYITRAAAAAPQTSRVQRAHAGFTGVLQEYAVASQHALLAVERACELVVQQLKAAAGLVSSKNRCAGKAQIHVKHTAVAAATNDRFQSFCQQFTHGDAVRNGLLHASL
jgi:hypothetical protein